LDLNELIREVLALTVRELSEHRIVLACELTKAIPHVLGDRVQLQQVLLSLIINGIEAMTGVTGRPRSLFVQSGVDQSRNALVAVRDSGTGLASDTVLMFAPFFTTKPHGMGLGFRSADHLSKLTEGGSGRSPILPTAACFASRYR
jgi:C4-dicarboxylate-specific signal transduction histidine kinase